MYAHTLPIGSVSDLKATYQATFRKAFSIALMVHLCAIGFYLVAFNQKEIRIIIASPIDFIEPIKPITDTPQMPDAQVTETVNPVIAIPEPVEDTRVSAEMTIATQAEMQQNTAPADHHIDEGRIVLNTPKPEKIVIDEEVLPPPNTFTPIEEFPTLVSQPSPVYPELARAQGIEGLVILKILIDTQGVVRDVKVTKGIGAGLDEAAVEAVLKSRWTPALQNNKPVVVWVAYRIRFKLR